MADPALVVSIWYSFHGPVGSSERLTAISSRPAVKVSLRNRMVANQACAVGSYQQRGSLVNSLPPSLNSSLTLNGPRTVCPWVS